MPQLVPLLFTLRWPSLKLKRPSPLLPVEEFGNLTQVWSTYESRHATGDAKPFARGINSVQLAHVQGRYWIVSIIWDAERPGLVLPEKYLK